MRGTVLGCSLEPQVPTQAALDTSRQAVQLNPDNPVAWNKPGESLFQSGQLDEAEAAFCKVVELGQLQNERALLARPIAWASSTRTRGDSWSAETMPPEALTLREALGAKESMAYDDGVLGQVYTARDEWDKAEAMHRAWCSTRP